MGQKWVYGLFTFVKTVIHANTDSRRVHREFIAVFTSEEVVCWEKLFSLEPQYGTKIGSFFFLPTRGNPEALTNIVLIYDSYERP